MKLPFNIVRPSGEILFGAKGGRIHSFALADNAHLSTWKHPDVDKVAETKAANTKAEAEAAAQTEDKVEDEPAEDGRPTKRQRLSGEQEAKPSGDDGAMDVDEPAVTEDKPKVNNDGGQKKKDRQAFARGRMSVRVPDQPFITHLLATSSGSHVVAISGHDKTIWVFEHDGKGSLKVSSQRTMPKRPCAFVITPNDKTILSADKFGDVYSLPLIPSPQTEQPVSERSTPAPTSQKAWKPEATNLTVHSGRNLESLRQQRLQAEKREKEGKPQDQAEKPTFEHTHIIGHVSLLTDLILAEKDGRRYILTADRDEHIRVSRFIPQAHVIEAFCMGHRNFVNTMAVAAGRPEILISGGGDDELYVWDWLESKLLAKFDLAQIARQSSPDLTKIAVTQIITAKTHDGQGTMVLVGVEGIQSLFVLSLPATSGELKLEQLVTLTGSPLHMAPLSDANGSLQRVLVATDAGEDSDPTSARVIALDFKAEGFTADASFQLQAAGPEDDEPDLAAEDARKLLRGVEELRKHRSDWQDGDADETPDAEAQ
ncbi:WD repeat-containing protein [Plectosphaerella plurivora]|uniref:WD repeat-containing protein n=1 Tax=Plectosphaerella plurivora TaxID=936078 RepID=A0A9P8VH36_9PEZI|nr:WD repeat-containing protein [Plectosphaerella plurivora]